MIAAGQQLRRTSCEDRPNNIHDNKRREAFLRTISTPLPVIADLYEGARRMIDAPHSPGRAAFVAHAVREIRARLPDAFVPLDDHLNYSQHLQGVRAQWDPVRSALNAADPRATSVELPVGVARELTELLDKDAKIPGKVKARFLQMCAVVAGEAIHWTGNERLAQQWNGIQIHEIAHSSVAPDVDTRAIAAFRKQESIIFRVFEYAAEREARIISLAAATTRETLAADVLELVTLHDKEILFSRLTDPAFFGPLAALGELAPDPKLHFWPQGDYVRRMATIIPAEVEVLLRTLQPSTPGVTRMMLEIALLLPDDRFINVMTRSKWLRVDPSLWLLDPTFAAMRRLATLGAIKPLAALARKLLEFRSEPSRWTEFTGERMTAVPKLDDADFADVIDTIAELLHTVDPMRAIDFFRMRLDCVIKLEDYTYDHCGFWSPNLLDADEQRIDVKQQLTGALTALALRAGANASAQVAAYFDDLGTNASLYRRIADVVVATHGSPADAAARIADPDRWTYGHECRALLERGFALLAGSVQERVLDALFARQRERVRRYLEENSGATSEDAEQLVAHTAAVMLGKTVHLTPEPYRTRLEAVATSDGEAAAADEASSALPALEQLPVAEVGAALALWVCADVSALPTSYGLGHSVSRYIHQNGGAWLAQPGLFATIPDYFLGWALNGVANYLRSQPGVHTFAIAIAIANAALARAQRLAQSANALDRDTANHIGQNAGALLVEHAKKATATAEVNQMLAAAQLLALLPRNDRFGSHSPWGASSDGLGDPATLAIHVIGQLSLVVHKEKLATERVRAAFHAVATTADHLERAALGRFFRWVAVIFPADAQRWADAIFFGADADANRAAWSGYIVWSEPHRDTHRLLRPAYHARIDDLAALGDEARDATNALKPIAEQTLWHVWVFCANDFEPLDDPQSLMCHLLVTISDVDLDRMLRKIASSLVHETGADRERIFERAMALWDRVSAQVAAGERTSLACSGIALWLSTPLPAIWRFAKAQSLRGTDMTVRRDAWLIVQAAADLRREHLRGALAMVERLMHPPTGEILTAVQQFGVELVVDGAAGDADEQHLAHRIDGYLVSNHRPSLLHKPLAS